MIDLVGKRHIFLLVSLIVIIPGLVALLMGGLKPGIDFTGGTRWEVKPLNQEANHTEKFKQVLANAGYEGTLVKHASLGEGDSAEDIIVIDLPGAIGVASKVELEDLLVRAQLVSGHEVTELVNTTGGAEAPGAPGVPEAAARDVSSSGSPDGSPATPGTVVLSPSQQMVTRLRLDPHAEVGFYSVGPTVGSELAGRAALAILAASAAILAYLTVVFRKVPQAVRYGVCAVVALLHDVLVILGIFAILGLLFGYEIDALFVTALLTIIGFSVHDTIVVFDRVRENVMKRRFESFEETVNYSLVQTLARSINTSVTVVLTLSALYMFGGASIRGFALVLLVGIVSGTYSSIFNASMMLVVWEKRDWEAWLPHLLDLLHLRRQSTADRTPGPTAG